MAFSVTSAFRQARKAKRGRPSLYDQQRQQPGGLTPAEQETLPYLKKEKEESEKEFSLWTPLEFIFDVLSRGQYASANVAEDIGRAISGENVNILSGLWDGITGKRKGDWRTTLFGGQDEGEERAYRGFVSEADTPDWMKKSIELPVLGDIDTRDVIGFLGNILLDPTTYISFGATKAGKKAASAYKQIATKNALKQVGNLDEIAKVAREGFDPKVFSDLLEQPGKKAEKYMAKWMADKDMSKIMNRVAKQSEREALRMTAEEAQKRLITGALNNKEKFLKTAKKNFFKTKTDEAAEFLEKSFGASEARAGLGKLIDYDESLDLLRHAETTPEQAQALYQRLLGEADAGNLKGLDLESSMGRTLNTVSEYTQEVERMYSDEFMQQFKGMGERAVFDFFGMEGIKYQYDPKSIAGSYDKLMDGLRKSKVGTGFSKAFESILYDDWSPIAALRKMFGVRNPYQTMLRTHEMNSDYLYREIAGNQVRDVADIFNTVDEDVANKVRDLMISYEDVNISVDEMLNPEALARIGIQEDQLDNVRQLLGKVKKYTSNLNKSEEKLIKQGLLKSYETRYNYLPTVQQQKVGRKTPRPGMNDPGFTQHKAFDMEQRVAIERAKIKMFTGLDDATVDKLIREKNWGTMNMDLQEMLMHRGLAHAQAVRHAEFVKQFREFGINFKLNQIKSGDTFDAIKEVDVEKTPDLIAAFRMERNFIQEMGLTTSKTPGFEDYLFDKDVAAIIDRVNPSLGSDIAYNKVENLLRRGSSLWRGYATFSPGFHLRNAKSNLWSLFMKDGAKAFNFIRGKDATIAAAYALGEDAFLKKLPKKLVEGSLNKNVAGKTIREWAEYARTKGIISRTTKGFDFAETVQEYAKKKPWYKKMNPADLDNYALSASKRFGAVIESSPKFTSFLNDIEQMAKYGDTSSEAQEWAVLQAKKWFFDYDDLTDFEQKKLKNIIPFYTWLRKNIALQLTQIGEKKNMYSAFAKLTNLQRDDDIDFEDIPEWAREEGYIAQGKGEDDMTRFIAPGLPYTDLNALPVRFDVENGIPIPKLSLGMAWDEFLQSASPLIQNFAALTSESGYSPFRKKDMGPQAPAPRFMRLIATKPELLPVIDSMIKGMGHRPGLNVRKDENGKMLIDSKTAEILETWMLPLVRIGQGEQVISAIFPQIEEAIDKASGYKDKYQGMEQMFQALAFLLGYKQKDIDLDQEQSTRFRQQLKRAEEARSRDKKKLPAYQKSLDKYRKAAEAKRKRYRSVL